MSTGNQRIFRGGWQRWKHYQNRQECGFQYADLFHVSCSFLLYQYHIVLLRSIADISRFVQKTDLVAKHSLKKSKMTLFAVE